MHMQLHIFIWKPSVAFKLFGMGCVVDRLKKQQLGELIQHRLPKEITSMVGPKPVCSPNSTTKFDETQKIHPFCHMLILVLCGVH